MLSGGAGEAGPLDGTNASKHQAMSYKRMKEKEGQLQGEVDELLRQAQEVMRRKTAGTVGTSAETSCRRSWPFGRAGFREAMAALEAEAQAAAEQAETGGKAHPGVPEDKAQRNFTDPESRIMPAAGGKDFGQAVVDHEHQVIVATRATNVASDKQQAVVMIGEAIANTGKVPREVSADAGYYSATAVADLQALGTDPFVAPEKTRHGHKPPPAPRGRIPKDLSPRDRMRRTDQAGSATLRVTHGDGGAGVRPDQAGPRVPAVPAAGFGEGAGRVVADQHRPQPAQAVPLRRAGSRQRSATSQYMGPASPDGRQASSQPDWIPADSQNVPTYYTPSENPATASQQLDYVFVSRGFHEKVRTSAWNDPDSWGPSDHCRLLIGIESGATGLNSL